MPRQRYSVEQVIEAIQHSRGIKAVVAKRLGCDWKTVDAYCQRYASVREALYAERQMLVDMAESQLVQRVTAGDWDAVKWTLATLGKDRGWVPRSEFGVTPRDLAVQLAEELGVDPDVVLARFRKALRVLG